MTDTQISSSPQITGNYNLNVNTGDITGVGGDVSIDVHQIVIALGKIDFFIPPLENYQPPHFISPPMMGQFLLSLAKNRLLIFVGDPTVNKEILARHTAWRMQHGLVNSTSNPHNLPVKEWDYSGAKRIDIALQQYKESTIFILPKLLPEHIDHNLEEFERTIKDRKHYVIATSDEDKLWENLQDKRIERFRQCLQAPTLYPYFHLIKVFKKKLEHSQDQLPQDLVENALTHEQIGDQQIGEIAQQLKTPENIDTFITTLCEGLEQHRESQAVVSSAVKDAINIAFKSDCDRIRQWYRNLPGLREKLLVVALYLFDGLQEDQFFTALEILIERAWQTREASLHSMDYEDFAQLQKFFWYPTEREGKLIKAHYPDFIFEAAWMTHRRHILNALPILVQFIKDSVEPKLQNWSLYGRLDQRDRLRKTLSDTISDIGLHNTQAVEEFLLCLATDWNPGVRAVAARAIARWRDYGEPEKVFSLVKNWMDSKETRKIINDIIKPETGEQKEKLVSRLKVTIGLIIGYASRSDPTNKIPKELYDPLEELAKSSNQDVRSGLCSFVIPLIISLHFAQMQGILIILTSDRNLHNRIARSIAYLYNDYPSSVYDMLNQWYHECLGSANQRNENFTDDHCAALIECFIRIYREILNEGEPDPEITQDILQRMYVVLTEKQDSNIRKEVMTILITHGRDHFSMFKDIIPSLSDEDKEKIVKNLVGIYLEQLGDVSYSIWDNTPERPRTPIEQEILDWMNEPENAITQQIAFRALSRFRHKFNEKKLILRAQTQDASTHVKQEQPQLPQTLEKPLRKVGLYPFNYFIHRIVPSLVALQLPQVRNIIRGVLSEALHQHKSCPATVDALLQDMTFFTDTITAKVAHRLRIAIPLAHLGWRGLLSSIVLLVLIVITGFLILRGWGWL